MLILGPYGRAALPNAYGGLNKQPVSSRMGSSGTKASYRMC